MDFAGDGGGVPGVEAGVLRWASGGGVERRAARVVLGGALVGGVPN